MCGIAGLVTFAPAAPDALEARARGMGERLAHRGPDGDGLHVSPGGRAALAHRRLALIDLSPTGAQPMACPERRRWLAFNGEVYNHADLRRDLEARGERFRGRSDTEVLL